MALLRDVPFSQYPVDPIANAAAADLTLFGADFKGPKSGGAVTTGTLFRGVTPADLKGPFISQFFYQPCNFGANKLEQKITTTLPGINYMTDFNTWLAVQRGFNQAPDAFDPIPRYMRNGRDIGQWVHIDVLFQGYFHAFLVLAGAGAPFDDGNPYTSNPTQDRVWNVWWTAHRHAALRSLNARIESCVVSKMVGSSAAPSRSSRSSRPSRTS